MDPVRKVLAWALGIVVSAFVIWGLFVMLAALKEIQPEGSPAHEALENTEEGLANATSLPTDEIEFWLLILVILGGGAAWITHEKGYWGNTP